MADVHAEILVRENLVALAHDETAKRPVTLTDREFAAAWIIYLGDRANGNFHAIGHETSSFHGATFRSSNMPGIASSATAVAIGYVAEGTQTIRVGAGGVMLPNQPGFWLSKG